MFSLEVRGKLKTRNQIGPSPCLGKLAFFSGVCMPVRCRVHSCSIGLVKLKTFATRQT